MKLFYHKKNGLNKAEAQFSAADYSVLTYDQLLKVNGAKGESGGGGQSGPSAETPSTPSGNLTGQGYPSSTDFNPGIAPAGGNLTSQGYPSSTDGFTPKPSPSGNLKDNGYPSSTYGYNPGAPAGSPASQGYPSSTAGYNTGAPSPSPSPATNEKGKISSGTGNNTSTQNTETNSSSKNYGGTSTISNGNNTTSNTGIPTSTTPTQKIESAIKNVGEKKYETGKYQCDEYVSDVIKKAGYNPKDYYVDNPSGKTINDHIGELKDSGKSYTTNASQLQPGTYVVFMQDTDGKKDSHAALLVVESGSSAYLRDNSSRNNATAWDKNGKEIAWAGGTQSYGGAGYSAKKICDDYAGYENFYFQKLN